jgi:hypothetical protein
MGMVNRYAIIENGTVKNVAMAEDDFAKAQGWVPAHDAGPGDTWDGVGFIKPQRAPDEPKPVSALEILSKLATEETDRLMDLLLLREVITPERAEKLKGK